LIPALIIAIALMEIASRDADFCPSCPSCIFDPLSSIYDLQPPASFFAQVAAG